MADESHLQEKAPPPYSDVQPPPYNTATAPPKTPVESKDYPEPHPEPQGVYPPHAQGVYPEQQGVYPEPQAVYPSHAQGPREVYPPRTQGVYPEPQEVYPPRTQGVYPEPQGVYLPRTQGVYPEPQGVYPPHTQGVYPERQMHDSYYAQARARLHAQRVLLEQQGVLPPRTQAYSSPVAPQADAVLIIQPNYCQQVNSAASPTSSRSDPAKPRDFLNTSIYSATLCFFNPFFLGCIAVAFSLYVDDAWYRGDARKAKIYSRTALALNIANIIMGIVMIAGVILILILVYT